jgi:hypothetical protein
MLYVNLQSEGIIISILSIIYAVLPRYDIDTIWTLKYDTLISKQYTYIIILCSLLNERNSSIYRMHEWRYFP